MVTQALRRFAPAIGILICASIVTVAAMRRSVRRPELVIGWGEEPHSPVHETRR